MCLKNDIEYILVEWLFEFWGFSFFFLLLWELYTLFLQIHC